MYFGHDENLSFKSSKYEEGITLVQQWSSPNIIHIKYMRSMNTYGDIFIKIKLKSNGCQNELHIWIPAEQSACKITINHFWSALHGPSQDPTALSSLFQRYIIWVTGPCAEFIPYTACLLIKDLPSPYLHYIASSSALLAKHHLFKFSLKVMPYVIQTCSWNCIF